MKLQLSTWQEVESYLKQKQSIVLPIGSTEQHGPNGLIGTDAICPEVIAVEIGRRCGIMVAPTISIGMAQHHLGFPGSITLRPSTLIQLLLDVMQSLHRHGFRKLYFLNGHGGNIATIQAAFSEFYAQFSLNGDETDSPETYLQNWWNGKRVQDYSKLHFAGREGSHATPSEVSLTYHAYPDSMKQARFEPEIAPRGPFRDARHYRQTFADGRIGSDPSIASVEHGSAIFEAAVQDTLDHMRGLDL